MVTTGIAAWTEIAFDTPGLRVRPLRADDEALYVSLYTDAGVMRHVGEPLAPARAVHAFATALDQAAQTPPAAWYWSLRPHGAGEAVGIMALLPDAGRASAELGLVLHPHAQGRGYASEAIAALREGLSRKDAPHRLWTRHVAANAAAMGLMRRACFTPEPEHGGFVRWSSTCGDWPASMPPAHGVCHDPPPAQ